MLRRQGPTAGPLAFLGGGSGMAGLIAAHDWSRHPFGPIESWPQSLRSPLGICLQSAFPTAIYWGPELRLLYNDAWAPIPGPRHPRALGAPAREVWSDIWAQIEPQFAQVIETGDGLFVQDQMLPMARFGYPEETYWSYSFTPIRGEDGSIAGIFNNGSETTAVVRSQRQLRFLLELDALLQSLADYSEGCRHVAQALAAHLAADVLAVVKTSANGSEVLAAWNRKGVALPPACGELALKVAEGEDIEFHDTRSAEAQLAKALAEAGFMSACSAAIAGEDTMTCVAAGAVPRGWSAFDRTTMSSALQRLQAFAQRLVSKEREEMILREMDHRARNLMAVAQSVVSLTLAETGDVRATVRERLAALARSQVLISKARWIAIDFATLLKEEFAPFPQVDVHLSGPKLPLQPTFAQTLSLVIHELSTNSVKYGALGQNGARIEVEWGVDDGTVHVEWREHPSQAIAAHSGATGFGTTLIDKIVRAQLRGRIERRLSDHGFACSLSFPLAVVS